MIKKINLHTDQNGLKMLRTKGVPVLSVTDDVREHINDLAETCLEDKNCAGLSSNQIWDSIINPPWNIFVIRTDIGCFAFINPVLEKVFKKTEVVKEGCMSVPGMACDIERPKHILVSFMDAEANKLENQHLFHMSARIWLHEYDHLQGKIITDYVHRRR